MSMNPIDLDTDSDRLSNTLAAVFATAQDSRNAVKELHKAGFRQTWLGKTRAADSESGRTVVENADFGIGRFFSDQESLQRALVRRGVSPLQAEQVERDIAPGCSVLTVYGEDNPQGAADVIVVNRGQVFADEGLLPTSVVVASVQPRTGVDKDAKKQTDEQVHRASEAARTGNGGTVGNVSTSGAVADLTDDDDAEEFVEYRSATRDTRSLP